MTTDALSPDDLDFLGRIAAATLHPVEPPTGVRARILNALHSVTIRAHEGRWLTAGPGVTIKKLSSTASTVTVLMELAPGATLPAHDHHAEATAHHGEIIASAEGCTLLVVMDRRDFEAA